MNRYFSFLLLSFLPLFVYSQPSRNQKFAAAVYAGGNFSQIHGDSYFGYRKLGARTGVEAHYLLDRKYFLSVGVGYIQEGASPSRKEIDANGGNATVLNLSMIEIPLLFNYRLEKKKDSRRKAKLDLYKRPTIQLGFKVTRLMGFRTVNRGLFGQILANPSYTEADIDFQDFDIHGVLGASFKIGYKYAIFVQHSLAIRGLYRQEDVQRLIGRPYFINQLRPYSLSIGGKVLIY